MAMHRFLMAAGLLTSAFAVPGMAVAEEAANGHGPVIEAQEWSFAPPFGGFKQGQLQRGYRVYKDICASCHSMRFLSFRNLAEVGGPHFSPAAVEMLASQVQVTDGPDAKGEMFQRPGRPSDRFPSRFANDEAARAANNGALPPDLSLMAKARAGGADYLYALLTGYQQAPAGFDLTQGMQYNTAFAGHQIAMPNPFVDGIVPYTDGTEPTVDNYAKDVSAFLMWSAEPTLEERHKVGARVMIFLFVFAFIMFLAKRAVWERLHRRDHSHTA